MDLNPWFLIPLVFVTVQIANICTTVYLHRQLSHRALVLSAPAEGVIRFFLWLTTTIDRRRWVAVHRKHHAFSDKEGDPHSPFLKGYWKVQMLNFFYYLKEARNEETVAKYSKDISEDWFDRLNQKNWISIIAFTTLYIFLLGPIWGPIAVLAHYGLFIMLNNTINGAGHWIGYKRFNNTATNLFVTALLTAGEGLHNNHHAFPSSPRLKQQWWEIDPGWMVIRTLKAFRLAQVNL